MLFFAKADTCVRQLQMYELISFTRQGFASLFFFNGMFHLISQPRFALKPQPHRRRLSFCAFGDIKTKNLSKTKSFSKILHDLSKVFTNFVLIFFSKTHRAVQVQQRAQDLRQSASASRFLISCKNSGITMPESPL